MAKILFISDNLVNEGLGIMCLSSYLKRNGHDVQLFLLSEFKGSEGLLRSIRKTKPDIIGFSVMTPQASQFWTVTKVIKESFNNLKIIWGGPHCMFTPEHVITNDAVDIICTGEGEEALLTLMNRLDANSDFDDIQSLWKKKGREWIKNEVGRLEENLDKYPFPDRELYFNKYWILRNFGVKRFMTQRGCPFDCSYCFEPSFKELYKNKGTFIRRHSVEYVMNEIKDIVGRYPANSIHFSDDTFNLNKNWLEDFLVRYKKEIKLPFTCNVNVLLCDEEMVVKMKDAGCNGVVFGLESGVERIRMNLLNKKITDRQYVEAARLLRKHKLTFVNNIIYGFPNETLEDTVESVRFNNSLRPYGIRPCILKIYKGTKLAKFVVANNLYEAVGEFTYKALDSNNQHESIKNMMWAGNVFVKLPFLVPFAKRILSSSISKFFKPLVLLNHWQDMWFYKVSLWQSSIYFWHSRKLFMKGLGGTQVDKYRKIQNEACIDK